MSNKIESLLIIGLGSIGQKHLKIVNSLRNDINIISLTSQNSEFKDLSLSTYIVDNLKEAMSYCPDAAIISNPSSCHLDSAIPLALKNIPILIEKPISDKSFKVDELINISNSQNSLIMVGYNLRFSNSLLFFKNLIEVQEIGKLFSVRASVGQNLESWRPGKDYKKSVSSSESLGGGVLLELSHEIDYLSWIFGTVKSVMGYCEKVSDLDIDVEDISHSFLTFESNHLHTNLVANLSLDFIRLDNSRYCVAIGKKGTLVWDGIKNSVDIFRDGKWENLYKDKENNSKTYEEELLHFFDCVENSKKPLINLEMSTNVLKVVEAIKLSSSLKTSIEINLNL